ncbi:MAG: hypothetical protein AAFY14_11375 [Pseudomonadota bacterium]
MAIELEQALVAAKSAIEEVNLSVADDKKLSDDLDAVLFGEGSGLDSIGLVNVVMAVEAHIGDLTGQDLVLASEAAMSRRNSPYRSLRALAEYAVEVSAEAA